MTKAELISQVAADTKISKAAAEKAINSIAKNVTKCLKRKDKITLTGFGTFLVTKRKARQGRNPQTGAPMNIKSANVPKFKPGKLLKSAVR